jgi:hypothetical protein
MCQDKGRVWRKGGIDGRHEGSSSHFHNSLEMQGMVYQMGKLDEYLPYQEVRDKVIGVAGQRAQRRTPTPQMNEVGRERRCTDGNGKTK